MMQRPSHPYDWQRFWVPRSGHIDLSDGGFLVDPNGNWGWGHGEKPATLDDLKKYSGLVLLGEPGIGKSVTLSVEADRSADGTNDSSIVSLSVDLRAYSSEAVLYKKVFESREMLTWKDGETHLNLFIDSLDEALLRIDSIGSLFAAELPELPAERMSLRIACRTAVWPQSTLEPALKEIWGDDSVGIFELAPLCRKDVISAAQANDIDADKFIGELFAANAVPFAIKPLTLKFLLSEYKRKGQLPRSIEEIYRLGCLSLCDEVNPSRRDSHRMGNLNAEQRLRLAGRIAAVTMLGNRYAVWTGPASGEVPDEDLRLSYLCVGREDGSFQGFDVTESSVAEVLDTGLFSARGVDRMGWAHQAYAEFLAARYLEEKHVPARNILRILLHPAGGLVPQLSVVTAWVASLNKTIRDQLISQAPLVLLWGDLANWGEEYLAKLTASVLSAFEGPVSDLVFGIFSQYAKLAHSGLASQLRPYIKIKTKKIPARRAALMIAKACVVKELQPELLKIALDTSEDDTIRAHAVSALEICGDSTVPMQVLPLAKGMLGPDSTDDIKGHALEILWPKYITCADLFSMLTRPNEGMVGSYVMFLTRKIPQTLTVNDLQHALPWATNFVKSVGHSGDWNRKSLADSILMLAWKHFEDPVLTPLFVDHVFALVHQYQEFLRGTDYRAQERFRAEVASDVERRRAFLVAANARSFTRIDGFQFMRASLLQRSDFDWLLSISPAGDAPVAGVDETSLCELVQIVFDPENQGQFESLYKAAERWPTLRKAYELWFDGVPINSPAAEQAREHLRLTKEFDLHKPAPISPSPAERVTARLEQFEAGDPDAWWLLNHDLQLSPTTTHSGFFDHEYVITGMPGWQNSDDETRQRILAAAEKFLTTALPLTAKWVGKDRFFRSDLGAYRALILLKQELPETYKSLPPEIWDKWAPVVVAAQRESNVQIYDELTNDASRKAPDIFAKTVRTMIRIARKKFNSAVQAQNPDLIPFTILFSIEGCWENPKLQTMALAELRDTANTPEQFGALLRPLLHAGVKRAEKYGLSVLQDTAVARRSYALVAAEHLMTETTGRAWPAVWKQVLADEQFGIELFLRLSHHRAYDPTFLPALSEAQLGELYIWLEQTFPRSSDPQHIPGQAHGVGPRESVAHFRDGVLTRLINLGTVNAVNALRAAVGQLPALTWLPYQLTAAEQTMRMRTWQPLTPHQILQTSQSKNGHLVQSPGDLLDTLIEALKDYERELYGEQHPIRSLWDRQANGSFRPIEEDALSDHVRLFLKRRLVDNGIILNREVELGRVPGGGIGRRTDIKIDAIRRLPKGGFDSITAVIETKGCWNAKLFAALRKQLYEDYLVTLAAPVGIYLVGWYHKDKWDETDSRKSATTAKTLDEVQTRLTQQADGLPAGYAVRAVMIDCRVPC